MGKTIRCETTTILNKKPSMITSCEPIDSTVEKANMRNIPQRLLHENLFTSVEF